MKLLATLAILVICIGPYVYGQTCPVNSTPSTWDWRGSSSYTFYLNGSRYNPTNGVVTKKSPWFDTNTNENVASFRFQNPKDYEPSGGWVLVQRDFGAPGRFINHPYFILYNKHSGILRIFVAISETVSGYDKAIISLKYAKDTRRTAILGFYSGTDYISPTKSFDNNVDEIIVGNSYAYDLPYWLHADFVMNYDPCTCNVSNPNLQFTVDLVSESKLTFMAEGNLTPKDELGRDSEGKLGFTDFTGSVKSATDTYSNTKKAIEAVQDIASGVGAADKDKPWELINFVPGLGFALGFVDALVGVFDDSKSNETKPTAYKLDFQAEGDFTTTGPQRDVYMNVPGSSINLVPPTTIQYDNALGVFTLIEKPTVIFRNLSSFDPCPSPYACTIYENILWLDKDLRYVMNPAISTSSFKIRASIEVQKNPGQTFASELQTYSCYAPSVVLEYKDNYQTNSVGSLQGKVFVKIAVYHKSGDNEAVFMARYPANVRSNDISNGCHAVSLHNNGTLMNALCGSSDYQNRANEYYRTTSDSEKVVASQSDSKEDDFLVYPNPSQGILDFNYKVKAVGDVHIYITDLTGKKIVDVTNQSSQSIGEYQVRLDLRATKGFSPGMYICRFRGTEGEKTRKVIIQ